MSAAGGKGATPADGVRSQIAPAAVVDLLGASALWGGMYVVSSATFQRIPPVTLAALRILVGAVVLVVVFRGRLRFSRTSARRVVAAGAVVAVTIVLQFVGTSLTTGAEGALLTTTTPAFVLLFGVLLERQRVRSIAWAGIGVALAGVALIAFRHGGIVGPSLDPNLLALSTPSIGPFFGSFVGDLMLVASAASWALFSSVGRPLVAEVGAFRAISQASCVAAVLLLPLVPLELAGHPMPPLDLPGLAAVVYLGVGSTAVAWSLWYRGYAASHATVAAAAFFAQPVIGATLGVLALGEVIDPSFVGGFVLIGAGVMVMTLGGRPDR